MCLIRSLISALWFSELLWETLEYVGEITVIVGAVGEVLADFEIILPGEENHDRRRRIEKRCAVVLIVGLALELGALARTNHLFDETIAGLYGTIADTSLKAEQLRTENLTLRKNVLTLEEKMQWRNLTKEQIDVICATLGPQLASRTTVVFHDGYGESMLYAKQFEQSVLRCSANLGGMGLQALGPSEPVTLGVRIRVSPIPTTDLSRRQRIATLLGERLKNAGVDIVEVSTKVGATNLLEIFVGPPVPPVLQPASGLGMTPGPSAPDTIRDNATRSRQ